MDFRKRSTEDQKPSDFEVSELLDWVDEEDQNNMEFTCLPTKKRKMSLTNLLKTSLRSYSICGRLMLFIGLPTASISIHYHLQKRK